MSYVVVKPESAEGIYDTWGECLAALDGTKGERRYMKVSTRDEAESILAGRGVVLTPGDYAFTDGNALGGVGVVLVAMAGELGEPVTTKEISTSVGRIFQEHPLPGLESADETGEALSRRRNILTEVAALYVVINEINTGDEITVVHDYDGVAHWMGEGSRLPKDGALKSLVTECRRRSREKDLGLTYRFQPGHRSTWAGRHDFALFNARADELAARGTRDDYSIG